MLVAVTEMGSGSSEAEEEEGGGWDGEIKLCEE